MNSTKCLRIFIIAIISVASNLILNAQPVIISYIPTSGVVGSSVTITGTGFNATPAANVVFVGGTKATVTAAIATSLTVTVPLGSTCKPITVILDFMLNYHNRDV